MFYIEKIGFGVFDSILDNEPEINYIDVSRQHEGLLFEVLVYCWRSYSDGFKSNLHLLDFGYRWLVHPFHGPGNMIVYSGTLGSIIPSPPSNNSFLLGMNDINS
ncbi:hypothetical protein ES703_111529 [subsurface metagenome]